MTFWQPGRRLFSTAAILMIITAALDTLGNMSGSVETPEEKKAFAAMEALRFPMGMTPSLADIFRTVTFTMSITFLALGALNLVGASSNISPSGLWRVGLVNAIWVGAFAALCWRHQIPRYSYARWRLRPC